MAKLSFDALGRPVAQPDAGPHPNVKDLSLEEMRAYGAERKKREAEDWALQMKNPREWNAAIDRKRQILARGLPNAEPSASALRSQATLAKEIEKADAVADAREKKVRELTARMTGLPVEEV